MKIKNNEQIENKIAVRELETSLVNQTIENLETLVEKRKEEFALELQKINELINRDEKGQQLNSLIISEMLFQPISQYYAIRPLYTPEKLQIAFLLYREMVVQSNLNGLKVIPTKAHFSRFCGFSMATYDQYKESTDLNMRNLMEVIDDYIYDTNTTSAQQREIDTITTMFKAKVDHRKIEATQPQIHIISPDADMEKIMSDIQRIKEGKKVIDYDIVEGHITEHNGTKTNDKNRPSKRDK